MGAHVAGYRVVCMQPESYEGFDSIPKNTKASNRTGLYTEVTENFATWPEKIPSTPGGGGSNPTQDNPDISQSLLPR